MAHIFPYLRKDRIRSRLLLAGLLLSAFSFRLFFGLHAPPTVGEEDEVQTYRIGLRSYTERSWPCYGPELIGSSTSYRGQIAGALEGLLVSLPLYVWPSPASPYLFLNILSFLAFTLLAWYASRRVPGLPTWAVFLWTYLAPWSVHFSTAVVNQSYSIVGSVLFVVGLMEAVPTLRAGLLSRPLANAMMGFGLAWMAQLHLSWVLFAPFWAYALHSQRKKGALGEALVFGLVGALPMLALLIPTYWVRGFSSGRDMLGSSSVSGRNTLAILSVFARFLSISGFETARFIGPHVEERLAYLTGCPWLTLPGFFLWGTSLLQPLILFGFWFVRAPERPGWDPVRKLSIAFAVALYLMFCFSGKAPSTFRFYEVFPVVLLYTFCCWERLAESAAWRRFGAAFLAAALYFQAGYALRASAERVSVFARYRPRMERAIAARNPNLLAAPRPGDLY